MTHYTETFQSLPVISLKTEENYWDLHPYLPQSDPDSEPQAPQINKASLHPIIVQKCKIGDFYTILSDRMRFSQIKRIHMISHVHCIVLPHAATAYTILHYILSDQQSYRPLTLMEEAYFIRLGIRHMGEKDFISLFLPRLGYPSLSSIVYELDQLITLETEIQCLIHRGLIDKKTAKDLLDLEKEDRMYISRLFQQLQVGSNKQRRLLQMGKDIAKRSRLSLKGLFSENDLQQIIHHPEMNIPQKTHFLLDSLQKKMTPRRHEAELYFQKKINSLKLPEHISITHTQNFEKNEVFFTIKFTDIEMCEKAWREKKLC